MFCKKILSFIYKFNTSKFCHRCQNIIKYSTERSCKRVKPLLDEGKDTVTTWLNNIDTVLVDCDGVIWLFDRVIEGSPETLNRLKQVGKKIYYVTNNSTKTREEIAKIAIQYGCNAETEEVITSSFLVANYLKQEGFSGKVYIIGCKGIARELELAGIEHLGTGPDINTTETTEELIKFIKLDQNVNAVVVGFDYHFSYPKILRAASYLERPTCKFLETNIDARYPGSARGVIFPAAGSIVQSIETSAGRQARCIGKPDEFVCKYLVENHGLKPERTLMIGDTCYTDILLGTRCGFHTLLVLSGTTQLHDLEKWRASSKPADHELLPDFHLKTLSDLLPYI